MARDSETRRERGFKRPKKELADENKIIGQRLRAARDAKNLSQRTVAAILGENQSWVSKVEQGERRADLAEGARLVSFDVRPGPPVESGTLGETLFELSAAGRFEEVERFFRPEFINRLDEVIVFKPLTKDNLDEMLIKSGYLAREKVYRK